MGAINLDHVDLGYGDKVVMRDVTLDLPAAALTTVIGPNGSGKSTLLRAISGLMSPLRGTISIDRDPAGRRAACAHVLQQTANAPLLPLTVREAVTMGRYPRTGMLRRLSAEDREAVDRSLERLGVTDLATRQLRELSGGQRQRVLVAQGLAQEAPVLLLDEPVTGLDLVSQRHIVRAIAEEVEAGRTVLLTTHDLNEAGQADVVILVAGRVVAAGMPSEVLSPENLREAYGPQLIDTGKGTALLPDVSHDHVHG
ncbi:metal ABC transporter ATP-binding protein [Euzebya tangerina]|uniref:metal ABC transporter ATP-binding protein n=1 Tax=Euzebya tangerina TaxID=591198 RepID=UPI000E319193|nr:metal ABC transporter ATP-binding protein [Euzebya tangerina]